MKKPYCDMTKEELYNELKQEEERYDYYKGLSLTLNLSRGKPSSMQLDFSLPMMDVIKSTSDYSSDVDCRNYGDVDGIPEAKELVAEILGVESDEVIVCGNSSLNIMFDTISKAYIKGIMGNTPWKDAGKISFLCPVPGYDRHFAILEYFGINMINVPMNDDGPDMDMVESYVNNDPSIKGIWCVPKYSNPTGITYSDEVVKRFAALTPAADDFRIFWDNAYCVHDLYEDKKDVLLSLTDELKKNGNEDMAYEYFSTSKISFAGAGIGAVATSVNNIKDLMSHIKLQTIGYDKINMLRHVRYFKNAEGVAKHMAKHASIIMPKFDAVIGILDSELADLDICRWSRPNGGYFISFDAMEGCAKEIVKLAKEAGVVMTGAGATFPYGRDPKDSNIRIAPTYPSLEDITIAAKLFVNCVKLASLRKLIAQKQD